MRDLLEALEELLPETDYHERSAAAGAINDLRDGSPVRPLVRWDNDDELRGDNPWDELDELPAPGGPFRKGDLERLIERSRSDRHASTAVIALFCDYAATGQYVPLPLAREVARRLSSILAGEKPTAALGLKRRKPGRPRKRRDAPPSVEKLLLALAAEQAMAEGLAWTEAWQLIRKSCCMSSPNTAKAIVRLAKRKDFRWEFPAADTRPGAAFPRLSIADLLPRLERESQVMAFLVEFHQHRAGSPSNLGSPHASSTDILLDELAFQRYGGLSALCEELSSMREKPIDPSTLPRSLPEERSMYGAASGHGLRALRGLRGWLESRVISRDLAG